MDSYAGIVGNAFGQRRPFEANEIDVDAVRYQRMGVVLHAGASPQISERNNGGSHSGNMVSRSGGGILSRFQESALEEFHDGRFFTAERLPQSRPKCRFGRAHSHGSR